MLYLGDFPAGHTKVCIPFDSFAAATGASSAASNFAASDILIYKDGSDTQRTSANGITVTTSFDSQTGLNMIVIDLSDNTDAGFYAAGHEYQVGVADITVDGQTVRFWAGTFSIERAGGILELLKGANGLSAIKSQTAAIETDTQDIQSRLPAALTAGGNIKADALAVSGSTTAADNAEVVFATDFATNYSTTTDKWQVEANVLQIEGADATNQIRDSIVDDATRIDASALNTLSAHDPGETIMGATDLGTGSGFTAIPWNAAWDAEVQSEVDDALVAQNLDHLVKSAVDTDFATTVHANSVVGHLADNGAGFDRTTDSLEAIRDNTGTAGAGLTAIDLPDQTMNITGNITGNLSGSVGSVTGNVGGTINGLTATALADFFDTDSGKTYADAVAGSVVAEIADNAGGGGLTAADIADAVWDEDATGHQTGGTFGQAVGDPGADTNSIFKAVVTDAAGATVGADTTAIKAKTDNLPTDPADASVIAGRFDTLDTAIADLPTNAELSTALAAADDAVLAAIAALNNLSAAEVNAEVVDALATDTYAEPTGVPGATVSLASKIGRLYQALRNKIEITATDKTFMDDSEAALWKKGLSDNGTTYSETEAAAP